MTAGHEKSASGRQPTTRSASGTQPKSTSPQLYAKRAARRPDSRSAVIERRIELEHIASQHPEHVPATREKLRIFRAVCERFPGSSTAAQRSRLLAALRLTPVTTYEARNSLDVSAPSQRLGELRRDHPHIVRTMARQAMNPGGALHAVAQYRLVHEDRGPF